MRAGRRRSAAGLSQVVLSLGLFMVLAALWGSWVGYTRVAETRARVQQVVAQGLAAGLVTPVTQGGGYETEPYGASGPPRILVAGVVRRAAMLAQDTVPGSTVAVGATGYAWTLPPDDAPRWDLRGAVTVTDVFLTSQAPYELHATVTAPVAVPVWGVATLPATLRLAIVLPIAGQQGPQRFVPY